MKRWLITGLPALLLLVALCGCSRLVPSSYTLVTPHNADTKTEPQSDVLTVYDYKTLKNALRTLVLLTALQLILGGGVSALIRVPKPERRSGRSRPRPDARHIT